MAKQKARPAQSIEGYTEAFSVRFKRSEAPLIIECASRRSLKVATWLRQIALEAARADEAKAGAA